MDLGFYNAPRYLVYFRGLLPVIKNLLWGINSLFVGENLIAFQEEVAYVMKTDDIRFTIYIF